MAGYLSLSELEVRMAYDGTSALRQAVLKLVASPRLGRDGPKHGEKGWFSTGLGGRRR